MASQNNHHHQMPDPFDPPNTTFVQADPSSFRSVVQRLTGANTSPSSRFSNAGPRRPDFKLQERRHGTRKLEITLNNGSGSFGPARVVAASPVSPLDAFGRSGGSPRTPVEEEEKAIAEKGFYLHPSPLSTPRGAGTEPELLTLFPLHSPRDDPASSSS